MDLLVKVSKKYLINTVIEIIRFPPVILYIFI